MTTIIDTDDTVLECDEAFIAAMRERHAARFDDDVWITVAYQYRHAWYRTGGGELSDESLIAFAFDVYKVCVRDMYPAAHAVLIDDGSWEFRIGNVRYHDGPPPLRVFVSGACPSQGSWPTELQAWHAAYVIVTKAQA